MQLHTLQYTLYRKYVATVKKVIADNKTTTISLVLKCFRACKVGLEKQKLGRILGVYAPDRPACHAKSKLYSGPNGPTASIFNGIEIIESVAMVCILNLDKISLKKLFPTMNI